MTSQQLVRFNLVNSLSELGRLNAELEQIGEIWGLSPKVILQLNLALDELFTNMVNYGLDKDSHKQMAFTIQLRNGELEIIMCDEGKPFDPTGSAAPDFKIPLEEKEIGGLGIFLVRQYTDSIDYRREKGKNIVTLTKKI